MNRREPVSKGYVNFPINDPSYTHTAEGGILVKLYVINDKWDDPDSFEICCGVVVTDALTESMIGSDRITPPTISRQSSHSSPVHMPILQYNSTSVNDIPERIINESQSERTLNEWIGFVLTGFYYGL